MLSGRRVILARRKDRILLPKLICERAGLVLTPIPRRGRFGSAAYYVDIPESYPRERAVRVARHIKMLGRKVGLGHVRNRLLRSAGIGLSPWEESRRSRDVPLWVRLPG